MRRTTQYISLFILTIMLMKIGVFAQPITGQVSYILDQNVSLEGPRGTYEWFFYVEEPWGVKDAQIVIEYVPTQLIDEIKSSLTLSINNRAFYSERLAKPLKSGRLKVTIPKEDIKIGYNKVTLKSYIALAQEGYVDTINTATWLNVFKESKIWLSYEEKEPVGLNHFPYPFIKATQNKTTDIIIPKDYTDGELETALWLSSTLGSYKPNSNLTHIKASNTIEDKTDKNIIWVGSQEAIQTTYPEIKLPSNESSMIFLDRTQEQNRLIVCGNTSEALVRAAKLLMNNEIIREIDAPYYIVNQDTHIDTLEVENLKETLSLKELGYEPIYMQGQRSQASVFINLPNEIVLQRGAKLVLKAKYAKNINFSSSLVTLYINNLAVSSGRLSEEKADGDSIDLYIDPKVNMGNGSEATLVFNLEMNSGRGITGEADTPWALIEENSYFYLPQSKAKDYSFNTFPYPFVRGNHLQDVGVITPDKLSDTDFKILGNLFGQIGGSMQSNEGSIKIIRQGQTNQLDSTRHLIIYGTPQNNAAISIINSTAFIRFNETNEYFLANRYINILPEHGAKLAVCEIKPSVANKELGMLTITAPNQKVLDKISKNAVVLPSTLGKVVVINEEGGGEIYYAEEEEFSPELDADQNRGEKYENEETFQSIQDSRLIIIAFGSMLVIGASLIGFLIYLKNKKG